MRRVLILLTAALAGAGALAVSAPRPPNAAPLTAEAASVCTEREAPPRTDPVPRPSYPAGHHVLGGERVVVHYTLSGADAPRPTDTAPANGTPDYVERIRDAVDASFRFFATPDFLGQRFPGFKTEFADTGGPDARLDVYVRALGEDIYGRAVPPTRGQGGAFLLVAPNLVNRPRGPTDFKGDGIRFTVSHEAFHVIQFGYVPDGMPRWIAEGTANTLAFFFESADHPFFLRQADSWLRKPDCSLWHRDFDCDRCYGGVWWWSVYKDVISRYFDRLARYAAEGVPLGEGVGALEDVFQERSPDASVIVTPALYHSFGLVFAPSLAEVGYPRKVRPPRVVASVVPRGRTAARRLRLNGMSVHYVALRVPRSARAFEVTATAADGPDPLVTTFVGFQRRPAPRRARYAREALPCALSFGRSYGWFPNRIAVNLRSRKERARSLLIVGNRSSKPISYRLQVRTLGRRTSSPSPWSAQGSTRIFGQLLCPNAEQVSRRFVDRSGDTPPVAPDVGEVFAATTAAPGDSRRVVTFLVYLENRAELGAGDRIVLSLDLDRNDRTGCAPAGAERALVVHGRFGADRVEFGRCRNGQMTMRDRGTFEARFDEHRRRLMIVARSGTDFGPGRAFNLRVDSSGAAGSATDSAPDSSVYCFPACRGGLR